MGEVIQFGKTMGVRITRTKYASVTAVKSGERVEVHVHGNLPTEALDQALDEAKRQIGTYEPTPLDRFLWENNLEAQILKHTPGEFGASLNANWREREQPKGRGQMRQASGKGPTPAAARRDLAKTISGQTLVVNAMLASSRDISVPDLTETGEKGTVQTAGRNQQEQMD